MSDQPEITQRDLRDKSREIMDAVEGGQAFTVTPDGRQIGELIPIRRRRRFVGVPCSWNTDCRALESQVASR